MANSTIQSNVARLAGLITDDIRRRGLTAGDRYLTAGQAGDFFGVSAPLASRTMRWLAARDILVRKAGSGTFIGAGAECESQQQLRYVHILVSAERLEMELPVRELMQGLMAALPSHELQFNVLPSGESLIQARQLLTRLSTAGLLSGLVLVKCSREVQELVCELRIPAVVFGGVFPTTEAIASVDADWRDVGRIMANHVLDQGRRRIAFITGDHWFPGDNQLLDGLNEAIATRNLPHGALVLRSLPTTASLAAEEIRKVLTQGQSPPTAVICRSYFGPTVHRVIESLGLRVGEDVMLVSDEQGTDLAAKLSWPSVCPELSFRAQASVVGDILKKIIDGEKPDPQHTLIPTVAQGQ